MYAYTYVGTINMSTFTFCVDFMSFLRLVNKSFALCLLSTFYGIFFPIDM